MLQISKGECQFLLDLIHELQTGAHDYSNLSALSELDETEELLSEVINREDNNANA